MQRTSLMPTAHHLLTPARITMTPSRYTKVCTFALCDAFQLPSNISCFPIRRGLSLKKSFRISPSYPWIDHSTLATAPAQPMESKGSSCTQPVLFCIRVPPMKCAGDEARPQSRRRLSMNAINICFIVFVAVTSMVALLRLHRIRTAGTQIPGYGSQTMCPACGAITARSEAHCLHCGKPLRTA